MDNRPPARFRPEDLPEPLAARILERASELDAARRTASGIDDLRAAATEAGISVHAFDAALAELQASEAARVADLAPKGARLSRRWVLTAAVVGLILTGALAWSRARTLPAESSTVQESIVLSCLSAGEAAALIRGQFDAESIEVIAPANAPRVLTVRTTPAVLQTVRTWLEQVDGAGSKACTVKSTAAVTR